MRHSEAVEDYLKTVFHLSTDARVATTTSLAQRMELAAPTVSAMIKRLEASGLVRRTPGHGVELTQHGRRHALGVVRRHRLLEAFLNEVLGVPWDEVHDEAEVLEHAISVRLEERIDLLLGHPTHDPHGDPIPPRSGEHVEDWASPLQSAVPGQLFLVERVSDRDCGVLRHLAERDIRPGTVLEILEWAPFGGPLWVSVGGRRHALGTGLVQVVHGRAV
ncbi:MAG: metal-dependent transcriptional regulator [Mycobacteriales bacterium]